MIKKIGKHKVDVSNQHCSEKLPCFCLGFDQGTFVQGRGYTKYHKKPLPVCWTRQMNGCPNVGVCGDCGIIYSPAAVEAGSCLSCGSENLEAYGEQQDV